MNTVLRVLGVLTVVSVALTVDGGFVGSYDDAPVTVDENQGTRTQEALAQVLRVESCLELPLDQGAYFNPGRERVADRLQPCAAVVLTGRNRDRVVAFLNRLQDRPYLNNALDPGSQVLLSVTTRSGQVCEAEPHLPLMRWRVLLWAAAGLCVLVICALGARGARAMLMVLCVGLIIAYVTVPMLAQGVWIPLVLVLSFALVAGVMLALWGQGWRVALCAASGTLAGLIVGAVIAFAAGRFMGLTGDAYAAIRAVRQYARFADLDFGQLLAFSITIIAMGASLDVAVDVLGGLIEFRRARPDATPKEVRRAGLRLNRDIAGTMVLTLCIAWFALRLPVIMATPNLAQAGQSAVRADAPSSQQPDDDHSRGAFTDEVRRERWTAWYAAEITQVVSACIAIMLAGPLSALAFSFVLPRGKGSAPKKPRNAAKLGQKATLVILVVLLVLSLYTLGRKRAQPSGVRLDVAAIEQETSVEKLQALATEQRVKGGWDAAMVVLWRARELDPEDPITHSDLAYVYVARRWMELARDSLERALPYLPEDAPTHYVAGVLAFWDGDYEDAGRELKRTLELDPEFKAAKEAQAQLPEWAKDGGTPPRDRKAPGQR